jgi:4-hydroxy-3-polyprenylbenzoate decarboxylase
MNNISLKAGALSQGPILIGVTGATGAIYARRLAQVLLEKQIATELIISEAGRQVIIYENETEILKLGLREHKISNLFAPPASGSANFRAMVIVPCSMGTLAKVAHGTADNLLIRAADVFLKENRRLILVPRETPYNGIHLQNMLKLSHEGALIIPASPGFYHHPTSILSLVDSVVAKILDHLEVEHNLIPPWGE